MACWIGKMHLPMPSPLGVAGEDTQLARLLSPGMVLLSRTRLHLGNLLIPGFWKHAATPRTATSTAPSSSSSA